MKNAQEHDDSEFFNPEIVTILDWKRFPCIAKDWSYGEVPYPEYYQRLKRVIEKPETKVRETVTTTEAVPGTDTDGHPPLGTPGT